MVRCARNFPTKIAYIDGDRMRTWKEMDERSTRLAAAFQRLGIEKGDVVAILTHEHVEVYEHLFACLKIGAVRVGINWRYSPREMLHVIRDSNAGLILVQANCVEPLKDHLDELREEGRLLVGYGGDHGLPLDYETIIAESNQAPQLPELAEEDLVALTFTSGTTGLPKGIKLTQRGMRDAVVYTVISMGLGPEDVWMNPTASAWVTFVLSLLNVANGMTVVLPNGDFDTRRFLEFVGRRRITATILVPVMMQRVLAEYKDGDYDISSFRLLTYGSSPAAPSLIRDMLETFGCQMVQMYGLSETTGGWVTYLHHADHVQGLRENPELLTSCGRAGMHMEISIRDGDGNRVPPGEMGEIWVRSGTVMAGYLNLPDQTTEAFSGGWLRTHDMGRLDEEGYLYLTDRKDFLIITGAANVYPSVVENALAEHEAVQESAVVGAPHPEWGEAVVAAVALKQGKSATPEELIAFCRKEVAGWEAPKFVEVVEELPRGLTGKILKKRLVERYRERPELLPWNETPTKRS